MQEQIMNSKTDLQMNIYIALAELLADQVRGQLEKVELKDN